MGALLFWPRGTGYLRKAYHQPVRRSVVSTEKELTDRVTSSQAKMPVSRKKVPTERVCVAVVVGSGLAAAILSTGVLIWLTDEAVHAII